MTTAYNSIRGQKPKHVQKHDVNLVSKAKLIQNSSILLPERFGFLKRLVTIFYVSKYKGKVLVVCTM